ncbi:hypothetical protein SLS63_011013 [Diaporthe eres]|uniref:Uncharacterized protein n=1 Tax=Diaporthe eres TaxID=83184 RepID=A0ABR1NV67_DIAER
MADDNHVNGGSTDHGARLSSETCVPYPTISLACREAFLVVKEFGSMVTAWDSNKLKRARRAAGSITDETDIYIRTWFSPKLDTIMIDSLDSRILERFGEAASCDLVNCLRSSTTKLVVRSNWSHYSMRLAHHAYQQYLESRDKVLLSIGEIEFVLKDKVWDIGTTAQMLGTVGSGQVIHLNDTATLNKYLELWEHCCQRETTSSWEIMTYDIGAWLKAAICVGKGEGARGFMRRYEAWVGGDKEYEERLVSPGVYYVLRLADHIMSAHWSQPNSRRGHEIMDCTGKLKTDHPLVQNLDIKLPEIIPVCTVRVIRRCRCVEHQAHSGFVMGPRN